MTIKTTTEYNIGTPGHDVNENAQKYKCSNPHCGAIYLYDPKTHCPACEEVGGSGYSCYPLSSSEGGK